METDYPFGRCLLIARSQFRQLIVEMLHVRLVASEELAVAVVAARREDGSCLLYTSDAADEL